MIRRCDLCDNRMHAVQKCTTQGCTQRHSVQQTLRADRKDTDKKRIDNACCCIRAFPRFGHASDSQTRRYTAYAMYVSFLDSRADGAKSTPFGSRTVQYLGAEELCVGGHRVVVDLPRALVQAVRERLEKGAHLCQKYLATEVAENEGGKKSLASTTRRGCQELDHDRASSKSSGAAKGNIQSVLACFLVVPRRTESQFLFLARRNQPALSLAFAVLRSALLPYLTMEIFLVSVW